MDNPLFKFPHIHTIDSFPAAMAGARKHGKVEDVVTYDGTVKLHGTCTGVLFRPDRTLIAQGRNRHLNVEHDFYGFAEFVSQFTADDFFQDPTVLTRFQGEHLVLYGEWVGPRIQKGTACSLLPKRTFVAFALGTESGSLLEAPLLKDPFKNVMTVGEPLRIHSDLSNYKEALRYAMDLTQQVDAECPWGKSQGIIGHGEGIVWKPRGTSRRLWLKTKGDSHKRKTAVADPERAQRMEKKEAASALLYDRTDCAERVSQGFADLQGTYPVVGVSHLPEFIKWFAPDFARECASVIAEVSKETGVEEKDLRKGVVAFAVKEFKKASEEALKAD